MRHADRIKLLLLMGLFAVPALAAWFTHQVWRPTGSQSYGELLEPRPPELAGMVDAQGRPATLQDLRGHWVLLTTVEGACAEDCLRQLYLTRQVRLAQGREMDRVVRAVIVGDGQPLPDEPGLHGYRISVEALRRLQPDAAVTVHVLDPLGRRMLRFPARPDGEAMIRDLRTLLKASKLG